MKIWGTWQLICGHCHSETRNLNGAAQMNNLQPLVCVARVLILLAARKSYDFSPGVGKTTCLSENVFETFGRPFSLASAIQYNQLLRTPAALVIPRRSVVSAGSRSLTSTTCICSTLLYQRYLGFGKGASSKSALPKRFCLGTRMLADF